MADNDDDYNETELRDKFKQETQVYDTSNMRDFDFDESDSDRKIVKNRSSSSENSDTLDTIKKYKVLRQSIDPPSPDVNYNNNDDDDDDDDQDDNDGRRNRLNSYKSRSKYPTGGSGRMSNNFGGSVGQNRRSHRNDYDSNRNSTGGAYSDLRRKSRQNFRTSGGSRYHNDDNDNYRGLNERMGNGRFNRNFDYGDGDDDNDVHPVGSSRGSLGGRFGAGKTQHSHFNNRRKRKFSGRDGRGGYGDSHFMADGSGHPGSLVHRSNADSIDMARAFSFKEFVITLDDSVVPKEAVMKYTDYINNFVSKQLPQFFERIKDFETVKLKYHPVYEQLNFASNRKSLLFRLKCFLALYLNGYLDGFSLDSYTTEMKTASLTSSCYIPSNDIDGVEEETRLVIEESVKSKLPDPSLLRMHYLLLIASNILLEMGSLEEVEIAKNQIIDFVASAEAEEMELEESDFGGSDDNSDDNAKVRISVNKKTSLLSEPVVEGRHNVVSVFVKNIPHDVTYDQVYKKYSTIEGFLRVYLPETFTWNKYFRRAYFTFKSGINRSRVLDEINSINFNELEKKKHFFSGIFVTNLNRHVLIKNSDSNQLVTYSTLLYDARMVVGMIKSLDSRYKLYDPEYRIDETELYFVQENEHPIIDQKTGNYKTDIDTDKFDKKAKITEDILFEKVPVEYLDPLPELNDFSFDHQQFPENTILAQLEAIVSQPSPDPLQLKATLDLAIFYLRFIHSIDYYGLVDFPNEHLRNIRLSSLTLRPIQSPWAVKQIEPISQSENENLANYAEDVDEKFAVYLKPLKLTDEEAKKLGEKTVETEIEDYIKRHLDVTVPDRCWCRLSNKKFKAFAYARKHILTSFKLALKKVELDTLYQNNFIRDRLHKIPHINGSSSSSAATIARNGATDFGVSSSRAFGANSHRSLNTSLSNSTNTNATSNKSNNDNFSSTNRYRNDQSIDKIQRMITQYTDLDAPDFD